ncbi:UNVERIFIED_CONTAM: hypothetical protein Sangu_0848800 [Sesamum angustifolium]|uniref:Ankyrin repeat family protein n=1 Tax=Sesamum angustifolium TaxID=2727405 RepID=A0AAW2PBX1_9LAMI
MGVAKNGNGVMKWKDENISGMQSQRLTVFSSPAREKYFSQHVPLHKAALKGDWEAAENLLSEDCSLAKASITEGGETALHVAALEGHASFVANLLDRMEASDLEAQNNKGSTALCFAAAAGHVDVAKLLVQKNPNLPTISGFEGVTPLYMAVLQAHSEMAHYLFSLPAFEFWTTDHQIALLTTAIDSGLYGLAMSIVDQHKTLAVIEDSNGETPLQVLARKPSAFCGSSGLQGLWDTSIATRILSHIKLKTPKNSAQCDAYKLLGYLWDSVISQEDVETAQIVGNTSKLFFVAAEAGNDEFLVELIRRYPDFLYKVNQSKHSIFHIAVLHRYVRVFNLMHELVGVKELIATYIDKDGNNMLHLAAKLSPQNQLNSIPGAALQMQREVLWYKEVEKIVQPLYRDMKNKSRPHTLRHIPGGARKLDERRRKTDEADGKIVHAGDDAHRDCRLHHCLHGSSNSVVFHFNVDVPVHTDVRYTEKDFLNSLPFWLVIGVGSLFISIVAMMVAFCTCLLSYEHGLVAATALLAFFASVPIMFIILKYELFGHCTALHIWLSMVISVKQSIVLLKV